MHNVHISHDKHISQKATLFSGTISSNVAFGDNGGDGFTSEDAKKAVHIAQADEFVEKKENGLFTNSRNSLSGRKENL